MGVACWHRDTVTCRTPTLIRPLKGGGDRSGVPVGGKTPHESLPVPALTNIADIDTIRAIDRMRSSIDISPGVLCDWLRDTRARSLALYGDLEGEQLLGPRLAIVNPPLWELGHLAWFQEHWCLRYRGEGRAPAPSLIDNADALYDSAIVAHDTRWDLPLLTWENTQRYLENVLERVLERLAREGDNPALRYFAQLAVHHEDMHGEAFLYTRQTLSYPRPELGAVTPEAVPATSAAAGDADIEGGTFHLGAPEQDGFVFDNEKWSHEVQVAPFRIARAAVSNADFLAWVEAAGYARREFWSDAGWAWREQANATQPLYWRKVDGAWQQREFDQWLPLREHAACVFVNWYEAQAYCRFAKRRLPSEAEWELAAAGLEKRRYPWGETAPTPRHANLDGAMTHTANVAAFAAGDTPQGLRQMFGNVWEWTEAWFAPYPGFVADPYKEYSQPWFGDHKVLRGGCFATRARLLRNTWRNFYTPDRRDVLAGFRTCAPD
jgi:gamma-glutamyl hercynylcysteine S-oxide synthase